MSEQSLNRPALLHTLQDRHGNPVTVRLNEQSARTLVDACAETFNWQIKIEAQPEAGQYSTAVELDKLAAAVMRSARMVPPSGTFGEDRVFINHVWRAWQNAGGEDDLKTFKHHLIACQEQALLQLGCAVLMHTLNAVDLAQSEIIDADDSAYHFVVLPKS